MDVAIVGAGMAGLACATALVEAGFSVRLFDKGRGASGRMATRRVASGGETLRFDHGAQYFTARDDAFRDQVARWEREGHVARWPAAGDGAWVGTPGMNAPLKAMASGLDVAWSTRIERVERDGSGWRIAGAGVDLRAKRLVVALPPEQTAALLVEGAPQLARIARSVRSEPCWALMAAFDCRLPARHDVVRPEHGPIAWAARDSAKPGRQYGERWVAHATPECSRELLEREPDEVADLLLRDLFAAVDAQPQTPAHAAAHRWRYAMAEPASGAVCRFDAAGGVGIAADWLVAPRVEGAWISGRSIANAILARVTA